MAKKCSHTKPLIWAVQYIQEMLDIDRQILFQKSLSCTQEDSKHDIDVFYS